jgi:cAMP-dependent protein kinase regulator
MLRQIKFLNQVGEDELNRLAEAVTEQRFASGETIIQEGQPGDSFFFIVAGYVLVWQDRNRLEELVAERGPGDYIGEQSLLHQLPRNATCIARTEVITLVLGKTDFEALARPYLERLAEQERVHHIVTTLQQMPEFNDLTIGQLERLAALAERVNYSAGELVIPTPDQHTYLFIVDSGQVRLHLPDSEAEGKLRYSWRSRGQFFGDLEYLAGLPPVISAIAVQDSRLLRLKQTEDYHKTIVQPNVRRVLTRLMRQFNSDQISPF